MQLPGIAARLKVIASTVLTALERIASSAGGRSGTVSLCTLNGVVSCTRFGAERAGSGSICLPCSH